MPIREQEDFSPPYLGHEFPTFDSSASVFDFPYGIGSFPTAQQSLYDPYLSNEPIVELSPYEGRAQMLQPIQPIQRPPWYFGELFAFNHPEYYQAQRRSLPWLRPEIPWMPWEKPPPVREIDPGIILPGPGVDPNRTRYVDPFNLPQGGLPGVVI